MRNGLRLKRATYSDRSCAWSSIVWAWVIDFNRKECELFVVKFSQRRTGRLSRRSKALRLPDPLIQSNDFDFDFERDHQRLSFPRLLHKIETATARHTQCHIP